MLVLCQMCTLKSAEDLKQNERLSSWPSLIPFESVSEFEHYVLQTFSGNWLYFTRELPFTLRKTGTQTCNTKISISTPRIPQSRP